MKEEKKVPDKTKEEVLEQLYVSASDLLILIPTITYPQALEYIKESIEIMEAKGYDVPKGRTLIALTSIVRKKFGF